MKIFFYLISPWCIGKARRPADSVDRISMTLLPPAQMHDDIPNTLPHQEWHAAAIWLVDCVTGCPSPKWNFSPNTFGHSHHHRLDTRQYFHLTMVHINKGWEMEERTQKIRSVLYWQDELCAKIYQLYNWVSTVPPVILWSCCN